jgi:hypothetical protein
LKENGYRYAQIVIGGAYSANDYANFDLQDGVIGDVSTTATATIQDVGNGWFRCSCTFPANATATGNSGIGFIESLTDGRVPTFAGDGTSGIAVYGAQVEVGSIPSSLIPTSSQQGTRAAETFTIPSANLPWPEPQYTGSELVTNGTFDTDVSGWSAGPNDSSVSWSSGQIDVTRLNTTTSGCFTGYQLVTGLTVGKTYWLQGDIITASNEASIMPSSALQSIGYSESYIRYSNNQVSNGFNSFPVTAKLAFEATATSMYIGVGARSSPTATATFDNISVREINPLSVSIGMEGRMTRESVNGSVTAMPIRWVEDGNNQIRIWHDSSIAGNGIRWDFDQEANNVIDQVSSGYINPFGILVPFDIASRHGSTFINGATDGVALTADTTPTALPDLSSTDLNLAYDYMGTISEFRVWDKDIGDAGIVEATNPSLEPSLSLTFEGTGTSSFTVSEWSE